MFTSFESAAVARDWLLASAGGGAVDAVDSGAETTAREAGDEVDACAGTDSRAVGAGTGVCGSAETTAGTGGGSEGTLLAAAVDAPALAGCAFSHAICSGASFDSLLDRYPVCSNCSRRKAVVRSRAS